MKNSVKAVMTAMLAGLLMSACSVAPVKEPVTFSGIAYFSMPWSVKVDALPAGVSQAQLQQTLQGQLDDANKVLSTYQPDTELMRFNGSPVGVWQNVSPTLYQAVTTSVQVSAASSVYDVSVGPLVDLWGFGAKAIPTKTPTPEQIQQAKDHVGWRWIGVDEQHKQLQRQRDISLNLSSLGEGVGVDLIQAELASRGIQHYMVSVAGTLRVNGNRPDGAPWRIAVEKPDGSGLPERILKLDQEDMAVSTSGSYRNYHEIEGVRYSHTIDPRTGKPITHKGISVTVIARRQSAALTDAWATALNALGPDEGYELALQKGIAAYYLVKTEQGFAEKYTPAFKPYLSDEPIHPSD